MKIWFKIDPLKLHKYQIVVKTEIPTNTLHKFNSNLKQETFTSVSVWCMKADHSSLSVTKVMYVYIYTATSNGPYLYYRHSYL